MTRRTQSTLIAKSGVAAPTITYNYPDTPSRGKEAAIIQASLQAAGFTVKLAPLPTGSYYSTVFDPTKAGDFGYGGWGADWPNASTVIPDLFTQKGGWDLSQVDDAAFNAEVLAAGAETDRAKQASDWQALNTETIEERLAHPDLLRARAGHGRIQAGHHHRSQRRLVPLGSLRLEAVRRHVRQAVTGSVVARTSTTAPRRAASPLPRGCNYPDVGEGKPVVAYLVRRVLLMVALLFILTATVFFLFNLLPGDPARLTCGKACSPQIIEANRHRLGLDDQPILTQYVEFFRGLVVGRTFSPDSPEPIVCHAPCLGYSFNRHAQVMT